MKKKRIAVFILLISVTLTACTMEKSNGPQIEYTNSDAIYQVAWQYVVAQINGISISDARITRMELVDTCSGSNASNVSIYALEYAYSMEQESGYYPGGTTAGSPYLFIANDHGTPQLLGVRFTKDVLASGGFSKIGQTVIDENKTTDFSKYSTDSTVFQAAEIDAAIKVAENYYLEETSESILPINTWFDENRYQADNMDCLENSLYGIDKAAERNDLIILYSDLYFLDSDSPSEGLARNWKTIMIRDSTNAPWRVVDTGY